MVVMFTGLDLSQEIFAVNMLRTLKSSLKHRRKHVLRSLQLYEDQALDRQSGTEIMLGKKTSWGLVFPKKTCSEIVPKE